MLSDYMDKQLTAYNIMTSELNNRHISHAYLIDENNCAYAFEIALSFVKEILAVDLDAQSKQMLFKRIDDGNYPEIKIIEPDGMLIKKKQILDLQLDFSMVAVEGSKRIYIIKDADKMRNETANSMLKFLEEPDNDIVAILLSNNVNNILSTIKSRCQVIRLNCDNTKDEDLELDNIVLSFINSLQNSGTKTIINLQTILYDKISLKDREKFVTFFDKMIDMYYDILKINMGNLNVNNSKYIDKLSEIANKNDRNVIIKGIEDLIKAKNMVRNNVNMGLLIDFLVINWR